MITHNNSSNFDSEFYKNQIEILSNGYFPEFDQPTRGKIENSFDYEKVLQTKFYKDRLDTKEFDNVENNFVNSSLLENQNSISNFQIVPQSNRSIEIFNVESIRKDFPILSEKVDGKNFLIWLDNAATTQKPKSVIDRLNYFYEHENSNVHRGAHALAARATDAYESARDKVARFLNAPSLNDIIFVRGATEAINLISQSFGKFNIQKDDEIIVSNLEHHANIVPWQLLASEVGAKIKVIPVDDSGQILLSEFERLITPRTKIVSVAHVSNALGTIVPIKEVTKIAHRYGVKVLIDGAQAISHIKVDVQDIDCDFYVFSGHKVFGPTGIGAIYGKKEVLATMYPYQGGGNMIADVTFEKTVYQEAPNKFEAGTGNIADAVGLGAAIDYVSKIGIDNIYRYEHELLEYAISKMTQISGLRLIGTAKEKTSVLSFVLDGFDTQKVGEYLTSKGIALRFGHHCAQPILRRFGVEATVRPSIAFYNTKEEIDFLVEKIKEFKNSHFR
ncbi:family 2A encapsulin nanocompartment cargo protein cysteine desulfurase [Aliarcobacter cibarius]|uniref:Cysteine desulfurase n=1 Tax=Aliarcobacter cibarius TaxID=255507 RepID=A0A5J6RJU2_9BACT|nr:family 2A encapsulin nanocompartment cargo protein cysteine desulfurase [Aliarcobacter cibarius]QEZ90242.1 cysteine desulfurase family protein [Aliarcobacter cibarius]QKJ26209.1 cysteine desulfurase family protein [Aliarcobacter cibarius]TLS97841.1 SufS family cysteine desulfurase [Aliarcobacter cibarius]TLS98612.1 SufS family cysteine desulfurase [Aliarcobacter cibarius]TLT02690.1 SufS family cysteine desulfurase [Aliarcobacter cibarius]